MLEPMNTAATRNTSHPETTMRRWARHQRARRGMTVLPVTQPPLVRDLSHRKLGGLMSKIIGRGDAPSGLRLPPVVASGTPLTIAALLPQMQHAWLRPAEARTP